MSNYNGVEIAVIGMACQVPGADNVNEFWDNLSKGKESISFFTDEELLAAGIPENILHSPDFVKANACIGNKEYFDSSFFGYTPAEAKMMDPQFRLFHENCWKALEDAGYDPWTTTEKIGLFGGGAIDTNWENYCALSNTDGLVDDFTASRLRNIGYLCSRIAYSFDLRGPAVFLYTACSTSLVAVQKACMSLLLRECSMALAGGIRINNYTVSGYSYKEGMINSMDGHCRAFDEKASGFVAGEGVGVVLLKRLKDAIEDGDNIQAVIKGSAINNDGHQKISYSALSIQGQHAAILKAINMAKIAPESISYVEAHGTSTRLGDAIEVEALNLAFGRGDKKYCALGSVKTNIGHLDTAAGIAALIKTVLALKHRQIPPSLHFEAPNSEISFNDSPFYVNTRLQPWESDKYPLRAGVSSFGVGGTNAHVILEEAPQMKPSSPARPYQLLVWSARTAEALDRNIDNFLQYLRQNDGADLGDIAYTLQTGRALFDHRKMIVCANRQDAIAQLTLGRAGVRTTHIPGKSAPLIVFVFSKRASHIEYGHARSLISWGIVPGVVIGEGTGEYTAAGISEVLSATTRFSEDAESLLQNGRVLFLEIGPGDLLNTLSGSGAFDSKRHKIISLVKDPMQTGDAIYLLVAALGELWLNRAEPQWKAFYGNEFRKRVSLPAYSFEKTKYPVNVDAVRILSEKVGRMAPGGRLTREPDVPSDGISVDVASASDSIETTLLRLWRKLFGKPDMTPDDDYFEAGGDSLKAWTLIGRIRDIYSVEVSIKEFFSRPTVRRLSEYIRSEKEADMPDLASDLIAATISTHKGSPANFEVI